MRDKNTNLNEKDEKQNVAEESAFIKFIVKNHLTLTFVLVIVIILIWAVAKMTGMEKSSLSEKQQLVSFYESSLDSLTFTSMELTAKVLAWAVRSEMIRENMDQVDQFFNTFVKEPNISKIQLIDPVTSKIIKSTDKKEEGNVIENTLILQAERTYHLSSESADKIISPVMGLDLRIGVLVIEMDIPGK